MRSLLALAFVLSSQLPAQRAASFDFTIPNIMRGPEVVGREPQQVRWSADGRWIYFRWLPPGTDWREPLKPYRVRALPGANPERLSDAQMDSAGPLAAPRVLSRDRRLAAVEYDGDLYVVDMQRATARRLTATLAAEHDPDFDAAGRRVFFVRDNNVFSVDVDGGLVTQLTDIRQGPEPKEDSARTAQRTVLEAQQRVLFESVRDKLRQDSIAKAERKAREALRVKPLYLGKDERVTSLSVSPTGRALLLVTTIAPSDARIADVPRYVTESGYVEETKERGKVGDVQDSGRVAFVSLPSGETKWLRVVPDDTAHAAAQVSLLGWNDAGTQALVFAVRRDYKARYIQTVSADSGRLRAVNVLRDTAWVDGPCFPCGGWYSDAEPGPRDASGRGARTSEQRIWYVSEADGYSHLYTSAADGSARRQETKGKWEVLDAELSPDRQWFYLHTSEPSPFERQFYRMPIAGGARERITQASGGHTAVPSPDGTMLADVYSTANRPPELYLARLAPGAGVPAAGGPFAQLTTSPTKAWLAFPWIAPEIVMIPASDGVQVPARIYRPKEMNAQPNGAGVIFVHGAGYLHNVHNYWSSYFREYMFNQYLASKGFVVLDIDYRGSAGYGRDWRTAIYRHMGGRDLQDHVDGARYLQKEFGIDPERIGIYGGSYGGFITLMALFTEPKWFGAGAALRSVTDWAHYNHWYTSRILNLPQSDTLAYRQSSPIYYAAGLEDPLLMAHGMVDVNVHFQDIVRLTERLIELGKTNWDLAVYPVEDHGFVRPSSWADEYRRIFELFERHLARPRSATASDGAGRKGGAP